jgi:hypothetical protein
VSELDISDDENEATPVVKERTPPVQNKPAKDKVKVEHQKLDDEIQEPDDEDTASDSWSECDSSDDDDHALVRTVSGRPSETHVEVKEEEKSNSKLTTEHVEDYFQFEHSSSTVIAVEDVLNLGEVVQQGEDYKKDAIVSVTVASETMTPLASPDEIEITS